MTEAPTTASKPAHQPDAPVASPGALRRRLGHWKWLVPLALFLAVVVYEAGPAQWLRKHLSDNLGLLVDLGLYGTLGPALAFTVLHFLERWMEERETSDLQGWLLAQNRVQAETSHRLTDDTLQSLFAVNIYLTSLQQAAPNLSPEAASRLQEAQTALNQAIRQLREHLLSSTGDRP